MQWFWHIFEPLKWIFVHPLRILCFFWVRGWESSANPKKCPYLGRLATYKKNKGTLFSPTLKVEKNKVPLFLWLEAWQPRYGHFVDLTPIPPKAAIFKRTQLLYLSNLTFYQENKDTFISSTLKVEEIKVSFFSG